MSVTMEAAGPRTQLLPMLCCPRCRAGLAEEPDAYRCRQCGAEFPVRNGIPRFAAGESYAKSFGDQWTKFQTEQLDSSSHSTLSHDRFYSLTAWTPERLRDQWILDAGCGAGRFAEIALSAGAHVVAIDMSNSVEVCHRNLAARFPGRLHVIQANIYELPLRPASFDAVYSIGVLQHTPDPKEAVRALGRMVRPEGQLALWIYERNWKSYIGCNAWKYGLRTITRHLGNRTNYCFAYGMTALLLPIWMPLVYCGRPGKLILSMLPVAANNYAGKGFAPARCFRCVVLDTFDWYSPAYDRPQRSSEIIQLLKDEHFTDVVRTAAGGITGRRGPG